MIATWSISGGFDEKSYLVVSFSSIGGKAESRHNLLASMAHICTTPTSRGYRLVSTPVRPHPSRGSFLSFHVQPEPLGLPLRR